MWVSRLHPRQMMITDDTIQFVQLPLALISLLQPICVDKCEMKGNVQVKLSKNLHNTVDLAAKGGICIKKKKKSKMCIDLKKHRTHNREHSLISYRTFASRSFVRILGGRDRWYGMNIGI